MEILVYLIAVALLCFVIFTTLFTYKKIKTLTIVFPLWAIYYWSIYGCFEVVNLKSNGDFHYIELEMMHFYMDENYVLALILYGIFIIIYGLVIIRCVIQKKQGVDYISIISLEGKGNKHTLKNVFIAIILFILYFYAYKTDIIYAQEYGLSVYEVTRHSSSLENSRMAIDFIGDTLLLICVSNIMTYSGCRKIAFCFILCLYAYLQMVMGNRSSLLIGGVICVLMYIEKNGVKKLFMSKNVVWVIVGGVFISLITFLRAVKYDDMLVVLKNYSLEDIGTLLLVGQSSIEKLAAHSSMYFSLREDLDITYGSSLYYLVSSVIPGFLGIERPDNIYKYYISSIGVISNKGFTINHITAWFLNFGIIGVCLGAYVWGMIITWLYNNYYSKKTYYAYLLLVFFSAFSIQMIRAGGPESYKGGLVLGAILPVITIKILNVRWWR